MSSVQNIKEYGDLLERHFAEISEINGIEYLVKLYDNIWGNYIGNDGSSNALPVTGNYMRGDDKDRVRLLLGQICYTVLHNHLLILKYENDYISKTKEKESVLANEEKINDYLYHSSLINNLTIVLFNSLELLTNNFEKYYKGASKGMVKLPKLRRFGLYRHSLMHEFRPFLKIENEIKFPKFKSEKDFPSDTKWIYSLDKDKFEEDDFWGFKDYFDFCKTENIKIFTIVTEEGYNYLKNEYGASKIEIQEEDYRNLRNSNVSGSLGNPPNVSPIR